MLTNLLTFYFEKCLRREDDILNTLNLKMLTDLLTNHLKINFVYILEMGIDQVWVKDNIDDIMKIFCKINTEFNVKDNESHRAAKSRHKNNMLKDMDKIAYRPIYFIARRDKDHLEMIHEKNSLRRGLDELEEINNGHFKTLNMYKEKSCKLELENIKLKNLIENLI